MENINCISCKNPLFKESENSDYDDFRLYVKPIEKAVSVLGIQFSHLSVDAGKRSELVFSYQCVNCGKDGQIEIDIEGQGDARYLQH